jgi:hypothetical protein
METLDVGPFLVARSDQLNADDLVGGSVVVQITAASAGNAEQPVILTISGGHKPWKPCKTMLRVMAFGWDDKNALAWVGRWVRLHRDASVKWGGVAIGGIRIEAMSHIPRNITLMLAETKGGKKIEHRIAVLMPPTSASVMPLNSLRGWLQKAIKEGVWTRDQVGALLIEHGAKPDAADKSESLPEDKRATVAELVKKPPPSQDDGPPEGAGIDPW